jgi:hypothetical protein
MSLLPFVAYSFEHSMLDEVWPLSFSPWICRGVVGLYTALLFAGFNELLVLTARGLLLFVGLASDCCRLLSLRGACTGS